MCRHMTSYKDVGRLQNRSAGDRTSRWSHWKFRDFTGIDAAYEPPTDPELRLVGVGSVEAAARRLVTLVTEENSDD